MLKEKQISVDTSSSDWPHCGGTYPYTASEQLFKKHLTLRAEDHQIFENRPKMVEKEVETLQENSKMFRN